MGFAQSALLHFEQINTAHGLSQSFVTAVMQDSRGFMWFGTSDGLNRYDGYDIKVFRSNPSDPQSLNNNFILCIYEDLSGRIWIGTEGGGLNLYDPASGRFSHFIHDPHDSTSLSNNRIFALYEAPSQPGVLWVGTNGGLDVAVLSGLDSTLSFSHFKYCPENEAGLSSIFIRDIVEDRQGDLWIGTWAGLDRLDRNTGTCVHYRPDPDDDYSISGVEIKTLHLDASGRLWIGMHDGGLNCFDRERNAFLRFPMQYKVKDIGHDYAGRIWVGTDSGLFRMNPDGTQWLRYMHHDIDPNSLSNNGIISLYGVGGDIIWVGTDTGGVNKIVQTHKGFAHIHAKGTEALRLPQNSIYALAESGDGSGIWIGTVAGLFSYYSLAERSLSTFSVYPKGHPRHEFGHVKALWEQDESHLWLGTTGGLKRFNPRTRRVRHFTHNPDDSTSHPLWGSVNALLPDRDNPQWLWVSFDDSGLARFDLLDESFRFYPHHPADSTSIPYHRNTAICHAEGRRLWLGSRSGLGLFDIDTERCVRYRQDPSVAGGISHPHVMCLHYTVQGVLWLGTAGGGLNRLSWPKGHAFDPDSAEVVYYMEEDGLPNNVIYGILEDADGGLWLSTNGGLSCFDPVSETFQNYDVSDGLQSNEFNTGAFHKCSDGRMLFGGINGFNLFYPDQIQGNTHRPPVVITDLQIFNESVPHGLESVLTVPITAARSLTLSHRDNVFSFQMAALDFVNPAKNQYAYMLEGFESEWNEIGTRRFATFTNIPPGHYTFRARASNNDGLWNASGVAMQVHITPPWTRTIWACVLFVLLILTVLAVIFRFWVNRTSMKNQLHLERLEAEKWQELDQMKSRFFANISHEFRTPLTLILGMARIHFNKASSPEDRSQFQMQIRNGQRLLRLVNQLLDLSCIDAGQMRLKVQAVDMVALVRGLCAAFESHVRQHEIDLQCTVDAERIMVRGCKERLEQIVSNLLTNAIKFTPAGGRVQVSVHTEEGVAVQISDTGPGISAKELPRIFDRFYQVDSDRVKGRLGTGIGLALSRELARLHQGDIEVSSVTGEGSTFTFQLPRCPDEMADDALDTQGEVQGDVISALEHDTAIDAPSLCHPEDNDALPCLLIVEDNSDMRQFICATLHEHYTIREAVNGKAGLAEARTHIPDLVISDVMMPEMDGYALCEALKSDARTSHIPVLLLTALADPRARLTGLKQGADDYLLKPFDGDELNVRIQNLIEQRRRLKASFRNAFLFGEDKRRPLSAEQGFLSQAADILESQLENPDLDVARFARQMGLSRSQLHRKLQGLTGQSTSEFIRSIRLRKAAVLLEEKTATVTEIAYQVGFNYPHHFSSCFKEMFGVSPTVFARQNGR